MLSQCCWPPSLKHTIEAIVCQCRTIWRSSPTECFIFKCSCSKRIVEGDKPTTLSTGWVTLTACLTACLTDCLSELTGCLSCPSDWLARCLSVWLTALSSQLTDWLIGWLTYWPDSLTCSLIVCLPRSLLHLSFLYNDQPLAFPSRAPAGPGNGCL